MTNRITTPPKARTVIVGVDTHTHVHVAVAIDSWGIRLGDHAFVADSGGYEALVTWAETHGRIEAFGIEGTGSYGAGLAWHGPGIVRLTLRPAQCRDEHSPAPLPSASLSARNHQPCRLA